MNIFYEGILMVINLDSKTEYLFRGSLPLNNTYRRHHPHHIVLENAKRSRKPQNAGVDEAWSNSTKPFLRNHNSSASYKMLFVLFVFQGQKQSFLKLIAG